MALRFAPARAHRAAAVAAALVLLAAANAGAQSNAPCPEGFPRTADLGIRSLEGNFNIQLKRVQNDPLVIRKVWKFYEEPRVTAVDPNGPSQGRLRSGDVLVAIDDALITTSEAGRRIGDLDPGRAVKITVRRDGRTVDVKVKPRSRCPDEQLVEVYRAVQQRVRTPRPPRAPRAPQAPQAIAPTPEVAPVPGVPEVRATPTPHAAVRRQNASRGWFGMGLDCGECGWATVPDGVVWRSNEFPTIYNVDTDSPADKGGLRRGDMLTEINGVSLLSDEGGQLFGSVKPGQPVTWTFQREGETKTAVVVAGTRPGPIQIEPGFDQEQLQKQLQDLQRQMRRRTPAPQRVRWTGSVGNADITVRGLSNVQVTTDEETGEIIITTADATIRVKKGDK